MPDHFSWIDHRLVREHFIERADVCAWSLYLFLVCVADAHGLSYYGEASLCRCLRLSRKRLAQARRDLVALDLIAYESPPYQVLSLPESVPVSVRCARLRPAGGGAMIDYATWCALRDGISRHLSPPQLAESLVLDVKTVRHWIGRPYWPSASIRLRPTWRWRRRRWN